MKLSIFIFNDHTLTKAGDIKIYYDKIINFIWFGKQNLLKDDIAYPYEIKKLSKADLGYRHFNLTHILICKKINVKKQQKIYVRLSFWQLLFINYYKKKFLWQSHSFRKRLFTSIIYFLIITLFTGIFMVIREYILEPTNNKNLNTHSFINKHKQKSMK